MRRKWIAALALGTLFYGSATVDAANRWGLEQGSVQLQSAGSLAFGPDGILLIGDPKAATVIAINTEDAKQADKPAYAVDGLDARIKQTLKADEVTINDLAVNPQSGAIYVSVTSKTGDKSSPAIVRVNAKGEVQNVQLDKVECAQAKIPNAPEDAVVQMGRRSSNPRMESITDINYAEGRILVSGLSNGPARSTVWEINLPFGQVETGTPLEIYHGAHGAVETNAPVRAFIAMNVDGKPSILAGYTCTPLVRFSFDSLKEDEKVRGTTVAELGNRNQPLDIIQYKKDGNDYLLMAKTPLVV